MRKAAHGLLRATSSRHRPWQLAAAVAIGCAIGILPKTSILFVVALGVCCCLPLHLPLALVTFLLVSLGAPSLEAAFGWLGARSLTHPRLIDSWLRLDSLPLIPWLGIHNTVIHGAVLVGLTTLAPIYALALALFRILFPCSPPAAGVIETQAVEVAALRPPLTFVPDQPNAPAEAAAAGQAIPADVAPDLSMARYAQAETSQQPHIQAGLAPDVETIEAPIVDWATDDETIHQLSELLADCGTPDLGDAGTEAVMQRAAEISDYVDKLLEGLAEPAASPAKQPVDRRDEGGQGQSAGAAATLPAGTMAQSPMPTQTRIEIWRRGPQPSDVVQSGAGSGAAMSPPEKSAPSAQRMSTDAGPQEATDVMEPGGYWRRSHTGGQIVPPQEQQLRYLLHHLKALKNKV